MKLTFKQNIRTKSGKVGDKSEIFVSRKNNTIACSRAYVYPRLTAHNTMTGNKMKSAALVYKMLSTGFISDLKRYAVAYNQQILPAKKVALNHFSVWIMAVCKYPNPLSDLNDIIDILGPSIGSWMNRGFLPRVNVTEPFQNQVGS